MKRSIKRIAIALLLCISFVSLSSCIFSPGYVINQAAGLYPETEDFPYTKWTCREIDLSINMFGYAERTMTGTYRVDGTPYDVIANFSFGAMEFWFYPSGNDSADSGFSRTEENCCGSINTTYQYNKKEGTIVCSRFGGSPVKDETIPETLTFENVGTFAQTPATRWIAEGVDGLEMYLDSFDDINGYFRGKMVIDGKKNFIQAINVGDNDYELFVENGKINNSREGTTSPLINMTFEIGEDRILAKVYRPSDSDLTKYEYWTYGDITVTFKSQTVQN